MTDKYRIKTLAIILCVAMMTIPVNTGFSKPPMTVVAYRSSLNTETGRVPRELILRSTAAMVEDQQTGERLIQKHATAVVPIASITKLMTAMVALDAFRSENR